MARRYTRVQFLDSLRLLVRGGSGGMGYPKYGGVGGKGGDVFVMAKEGHTLKNVLHKHRTKRVIAGHGGNSQSYRILGERGADVTVEVPLGITVIDEHGHALGSLDTQGSKVLVARGGPGGCPANQFSGARGQGHTITLDLKLIADIGLVGFPNAGKSTLLKSISNAKPKIASYPFTTISPNVGMLEYPDKRQITMADLPGLIEGAHANIGMGHRFLKHVERTRLLLLVVDVQGFQLSPRCAPRSCFDTIVLLNKELELYKEDLLDKPAVIVVNKMDVSGAKKMFDEIKEKLRNLPSLLEEFPEHLRPNRALEFDDVIPISAETDLQSVNFVKNRLRDVLDFHAELNQMREVTDSQLMQQLQKERVEVGPLLT